jgi:farnesyl-diphosphate farnesyltransferase
MTAIPDHSDDDAFIDEFLQGTSRTFALAIPLLESMRRRQVGLSYLLFRVADSIEDAPGTDAVTKKALLQSLQSCLGKGMAGGSACEAFQDEAVLGLTQLWPVQSPTGRLLVELPRLMAILSGFPPSVSRAIEKSLAATAEGMSAYIDASSGSPNQIQIRTLMDLKLYCYAVAGIVGELLTDIFVIHHAAGLAVHSELHALSSGFGEFLQLINILKDSDVDAAAGRVFIPIDASREDVHDLVFQGRRVALEYVRTLEGNGFPPDVVLFCRFLFLLADRSFQRLRDGGAGSKLTRHEVQQILVDVRSEASALPA